MSELYDIKGFPVHAGDLVRTYHYTGSRGKINYLYHVISQAEHGLKMLPAEWADLNADKSGGGSCYFDQKFLDSYSATIVNGGGKYPNCCLENRQKRKKTND